MSPARSWAVLFDVDGTLLDTVGFILQSMHHAFDGRARRPTDSEWIAHIGTPIRSMVPRYTDDPEDAAAVVARYRAFQREHHDRLTRPFPAALEVVRWLHDRGHAIGVVTGKTDALAARSLAHVGLAPYVHTIVGADSCPRHKPDPEPVLLALERMGRHAGEALFVGDSVLDVEAGNAAGAVSVAALWGATPRAALVAARPRHVLDDLAALPELVERLSR